MKRKEFIKELVEVGCYLKRDGSKRDIYVNPKNGRKAPIPGHDEIKNKIRFVN